VIILEALLFAIRCDGSHAYLLYRFVSFDPLLLFFSFFLFFTTSKRVFFCTSEEDLRK
jgi:hypothetical protein